MKLAKKLMTQPIRDHQPRVKVRKKEPAKPSTNRDAWSLLEYKVAPPYDYSSVHLRLDHGEYDPHEGHPHEQVLGFSNSIPDHELASHGREDEPHITVKYGLHDDEPDHVAKIVRDFGPVKVRIGKASIFPASSQQGVGERADVLKLDVHGDDIHRLNKLISDSARNTTKYPEYKPHITVAFLKPGMGKKYVGDDRLENRVIEFNNMVFSNTKGNKDIVPLVESPSYAESVRRFLSGLRIQADAGWTEERVRHHEDIIKSMRIKPEDFADMIKDDAIGVQCMLMEKMWREEQGIAQDQRDQEDEDRWRRCVDWLKARIAAGDDDLIFGYLMHCDHCGYIGMPASNGGKQVCPKCDQPKVRYDDVGNPIHEQSARSRYAIVPKDVSSIETELSPTVAAGSYAAKKLGKQRDKASRADIEQFIEASKERGDKDPVTGRPALPIMFTIADRAKNGIYYNQKTGATFRANGGKDFGINDERDGDYGWAAEINVAGHVEKGLDHSHGLWVPCAGTHDLSLGSHGIPAVVAEMHAAVQNGDAKPKHLLSWINSTCNRVGIKEEFDDMDEFACKMRNMPKEMIADYRAFKFRSSAKQGAVSAFDIRRDLSAKLTPLHQHGRKGGAPFPLPGWREIVENINHEGSDLETLPMGSPVAVVYGDPEAELSETTKGDPASHPAYNVLVPGINLGMPKKVGLLELAPPALVKEWKKRFENKLPPDVGMRDDHPKASTQRGALFNSLVKKAKHHIDYRTARSLGHAD